MLDDSRTSQRDSLKPKKLTKAEHKRMEKMKKIQEKEEIKRMKEIQTEAMRQAKKLRTSTKDLKRADKSSASCDVDKSGDPH
jgi:hypothetical protein